MREERRRENDKNWDEIKSFINDKKKPKYLNLSKILFDALVKHDYDALGKLHQNALFIGMMHFMDPYNYDQQRIERCDIHYTTPDGRIIPFCSFNVLPELYRDKVQGDFSYSWQEFREKHKKDTKSDKDPMMKYKRDEKALSGTEIYKKAYLGNKYFTAKSKVPKKK